MKTVTKLTLLFFLITIAFVGAYSQSTRMVTKNANGSEEYLFYHHVNDNYRYASSSRPKRIKLITVRKIMRNGQKTHTVKFPGNNTTYRIAQSGNYLICTNPDGSTQRFFSEEKLTSKGKNGLIEYLYIRGASFYYTNNRNPKWTLLQVVGGNASSPIVKFPNSPKRYKFTFVIDGSIICKNPDGTTQNFTKDY